MADVNVVVVGSCMTDLVSYVPRLPKPGETLQGHRFSKGFGGKGANQCIMAARLGATTAMVAKLGDDTFGQDTMRNFQNNSVNTDHVQIVAGEMSGVAPISVNDEGENAIVIIPGANFKLCPKDVESASAVISSAKVLVCQLEVPNDTTLEALKLAKKNNVITLFNAAPGKPGLTDEFFANTDILCVNETEAELIAGVPVKDLYTGSEAVKLLQSKGCGCVVLTMGRSGVLFSGGSTTGEGEGRNLIHVPAREVTVVDTTGAGDAFVGALAFYLSRLPSLSFKDMIERSCKIASHTVTMPGTQSSFIVEKLPSELFSV